MEPGGGAERRRAGLGEEKRPLIGLAATRHKPRPLPPIGSGWTDHAPVAKPRPLRLSGMP